MRDDGTLPDDAALTAEIDRLLAERRAGRDEAARRAFTERVMAAIHEPAPSVPHPRRRMIMVGGALVAAVVLAFWLPRLWEPSGAQALFQARVAAEKYPITRGTDGFVHPALIEHEGETLVAVRYAYAGVRCLWIYPEHEVIDWERNASAEELARHPRWPLRVTDGRFTLPEAALENVFGDAERLVMMDLGPHIEIWPAEGLAGHLSEANTAN